MIKTIIENSRKGASIDIIFDPEFPANVPSNEIPSNWIRKNSLGLPELAEVEIVRHFTKLTRDNYGVDNGTYPLGSCTMKYNPKLNDSIADHPNFSLLHPLQDSDTLTGLWETLYELQEWIAELLGMDFVSLQPASGAHGELAGVLIIKKYFEVRGELDRKIMLIADAAHGTNPASAAMAGFKCRSIPTKRDGLMDLDFLKSEINPSVAAIMLTNPSTFGLFEEQISAIANLLHENGSLLYYDGANMNALMGIARPGDMGFDIAHINTHKTLSTPHGGGGPGAGPLAVKAFLKDYLPVPIIDKSPQENVILQYALPHSIGRVKAFYGHVDILLRAYAYILRMGAEGLKEASQNAVLNANYLRANLKNILPAFFEKLCMHECLLNGSDLKISALSFAKKLIDYGIYPPTLVGAGCVYFPEQMKSALLIEPTETETKQDLDRLIDIYNRVIDESK